MVINMNRILEIQIDVLRLKIDVDVKYIENEKKKIVIEKDKVIRLKEMEIELLKIIVKDCEIKIKKLQSVIEERDFQILLKIEEIDEFCIFVMEIEDYVEELLKKVYKFKDEKKYLEYNGVYRE